MNFLHLWEHTQNYIPHWDKIDKIELFYQWIGLLQIKHEILIITIYCKM